MLKTWYIILFILLSSLSYLGGNAHSALAVFFSHDSFTQRICLKVLPTIQCSKMNDWWWSNNRMHDILKQRCAHNNHLVICRHNTTFVQRSLRNLKNVSFIHESKTATPPKHAYSTNYIVKIIMHSTDMKKKSMQQCHQLHIISKGKA